MKRSARGLGLGLVAWAALTGGTSCSRKQASQIAQQVSGLPTENQVRLLSSEGVHSDCSTGAGRYRYEILNSDSDIRLCQEYTLDLPAGSARRGERSSCAGKDRFAAPGAEWTYSATERKWVKETQTSNHPNLVPGDFRLHVLDPSSGLIQAGPILKVRHYGAESCFATAASTSTQSGARVCSWSGADSAPSTPPTTACMASADGTQVASGGVLYTCSCASVTGSAALELKEVSATAPVVTMPSPGASPAPAGTMTPSSGGAGKVCNPPGTTIKMADKTYTMGVSGVPRTYYYPNTSSEIYVFPFRSAAASTQMVSGRPIVAPTGVSNPGFDVTVSECPGQLDTTQVDIGCFTTGVEAVGVNSVVNTTWEQLSAGRPGLNRRAFCFIKPDTQYYFTVRAKNCGSPSTCGFNFQGN